MDQQTQQPTADTAQLTGALEELLKAANATNAQPLNKGDGVSIANSGTTSDGKPAGGGQGSMSDAGSIDDLMIGKMAAAGVPAALIAGFRAFMSMTDDEKKKKAAQANGGAVPQPPFINKSESAAAIITNDPELQEGVDASPFMDALVTRTAEAIESLEKSLGSQLLKAADVAVRSARALVEVGKLVKSQQATIDELGRRLGVVERAPVAAPKGATGTNGARALNKSGTVGAEEAPKLLKSEALSTLSYMNLVKGVKQLPHGVKTSDAIFMLEGGNVIDPQALAAAQAFLVANPAEAEQAKRYA